jgi:Flp pilus assembly protein TadG
MSMDQKLAQVAGGLKRLLKNSAGNVSIFLGIAAIPMFLGMGTAVDSILASREKTAFQAALDAATVAVAADDRSDFTGLSVSDKATKLEKLRLMAETFLKSNYVSGTGGATDITITLAIDGNKISTTAHHSYPTAIMGLIGISEISMNLASETQRAHSGGVELTMVMDTTGSMDWNAAGNFTNDDTVRRITGSRLAARQLLTTIYGGTATAFPDNPNIRLSFVPFAMAVNLDNTIADFQSGWIDTLHLNPLSSLNKNAGRIAKDNYAAWNGNWTGCVETRAMTTGVAGTDFNLNDAAPVATTPATLFPAYYNPNGGNGGPTSGCAATNIVPMTYKRAKVEQGITDMSALGGTVIPEGLAWGWRTISPTEPFTKVEASANQPAALIAPYHDSKWHKIMVLMTDGDNRVTAGAYSSYGYSNIAVDANNRYGVITTTTNSTADAVLDGVIDGNLTTLCNNVKAEGVELYVTGFGTSMSQATRDILKTCATSPSSTHYADAADNAALLKFFKQIGDNINNNLLYVSK